MKKESGSRVGRLFKRLFNFRKWSDWDRVKSFTLYIVECVNQLFVPQPPTEEVESFDNVMKRLQLSEEDIIKKQSGLFRLFVVMCCMAFFLFAYAIYEISDGAILGFILSLVVMSIALVLAFRYHFWYFQIKQRRLGCTFTEWVHQGLGMSKFLKR